MNHVQFLAYLNDRIRDAGTQAELARRLGISPAYLGDVVWERRLPGKKLLAALGLCKVVRYERLPDA